MFDAAGNGCDAAAAGAALTGDRPFHEVEACITNAPQHWNTHRTWHLPAQQQALLGEQRLGCSLPPRRLRHHQPVALLPVSRPPLWACCCRACAPPPHCCSLPQLFLHPPPLICSSVHGQARWTIWSLPHHHHHHQRWMPLS